MRRAVGFDLDMTLVDTRRGIELALVALGEQTGRPIDAAAIVGSLGPPIADALAPWFAAAELPDAVHGFRQNMAKVGVMNVTPMPGAATAIDRTRAAGFDIVVITSKLEPLAEETLRYAGLECDRIFGNRWAHAEAEPLLDTRAICYVGDHPGDMAAAIEARVAGFGVTSGSSNHAELVAAGAQHVAASLEEFPDWLTSILA